jgi:hypothetical protein
MDDAQDFSLQNKYSRTKMKTKKAVITILLVRESEEKSNEELEKEIFESLRKSSPMIPWFARVEKVKVIES